MKIHLFVVSEGEDPPWVAGAWDEYSIEENCRGYNEAVADHEKRYGNRFRVGIVRVPDGFLSSLFRPRKVDGVVENRMK